MQPPAKMARKYRAPQFPGALLPSPFPLFEMAHPHAPLFADTKTLHPVPWYKVNRTGGKIGNIRPASALSLFGLFFQLFT